MKASKKLVKEYQIAIGKVLLAYPDAIDRYRAGKFPRADKTKDKNMRFRWDLLWAAQSMKVFTFDNTKTENLNDNHIDTVLRKVCPKL